jgi:hypothetical protein
LLVLLKKIQQRAGAKIKDLLESNLISEKAFEAALVDDFKLFLTLRSRHIYELILAKTGWKADSKSSQLPADNELDEDLIDGEG